MKWWIYRDGESSTRPYSKDELQSSVDIDPDTRVRARGGTFRQPARDVPELQDLFSETAEPSRQGVSRESLGDIFENTAPPEPVEPAEVRMSPGASARFRTARKQFRFDWLLANPFRFFRSLDPEGSNLFALSFALVVVLVSRFFVLTYASLIPGYRLAVREVLPPLGPLGVPPSLVLSIYYLFVLPAVVAFTLLAGSVLYHSLLVVLGWNRVGFSGTYKVCCYTMVSSLAETIPLLGGGLALLWGLVLFVIGMMEVQDLSVTRSVGLSLVPLIAVTGVVSLGLAV